MHLRAGSPIAGIFALIIKVLRKDLEGLLCTNNILLRSFPPPSISVTPSVEEFQMTESISDAAAAEIVKGVLDEEENENNSVGSGSGNDNNDNDEDNSVAGSDDFIVSDDEDADQKKKSKKSKDGKRDKKKSKKEKKKDKKKRDRERELEEEEEEAAAKGYVRSVLLSILY